MSPSFKQTNPRTIITRKQKYSKILVKMLLKNDVIPTTTIYSNTGFK